MGALAARTPGKTRGARPVLGLPVATLEFEASYPEGFSYLNGVRELPDGRVLAADPLGQLLLRIDLATSTADTLGGSGPGPRSTSSPTRSSPFPGIPLCWWIWERCN